jgi:hypothetical protein
VSADQSVRTSGYEEPRSSLNPRFLGLFLILPVVGEAASIVLTVLVGGAFAALVGLFLVAILVGGGMVSRSWPAGIRVDSSGITIGAIRSHQAATRTPTAWRQAWGVYTCPWEAISTARVITDPATLRQLAKSPDYYTLTNRWGGKFDMTYCNIGVLSAPFMRAALVAEIAPSQVTGSSVLPGTGYEGYKRGRRDRQVPPRMSAIWIVPTRHPQALEEALKRYRLMESTEALSINLINPCEPRLGIEVSYR